MTPTEATDRKTRAVPPGSWRLRNQFGLLALFAFSAVSVFGFAIFAVAPHGPANVARLNEYPALLRFYTVSFSFFGRVQVWLAFAVLISLLYKSVRLRWVISFLVICLAGLSAELIGTTVGLPFGSYSYTDLLGYKIAGKVPWVIPVSWYIIAIPSFALALLAFPKNRAARIGTGAFLVMLWDFALDPAMSYLTSYWIWADAGPYYSMPLINFVGWFLTGLLLMSLFEWLRAADWIARIESQWMYAYYVLTIALPLAMMTVAGLWMGVLLTSCLVGAVLMFIHRRAVRRNLLAESILPTSSEVDDYFAYHSKSFSYASNWFAPREREIVGKLYAFCRYTDDIGDDPESTSEEKIARLNDWEQIVLDSYNGSASNRQWLDDLMSLTQSSGVPFSTVTDLIKGVRSDVGRVRVRDEDELWNYCYMVAGTVGVWLCYLFGATDPLSLDRAKRLGQAMQITNILRDVGADLEMDRVYLPETMMDRFNLDVDALRALQSRDTMPGEYQSLIRELSRSAEEQYDRSWEGIYRLPGTFGRSAAVAAMVYRGILRRIKSNGYNNLSKRAHTSTFSKFLLGAQGLRRLRRGRRAIHPSSIPPSGGAEETVWRRAAVQIRQHIMIVLFGLISHAAVAQTPTIHDVRNLYVQSAEDRMLIDSAEVVLANLAHPGQEMAVAYGAALTIMRAKHARWPFSKMKHLRRGLPVLDDLVAEHPAHAEIRYLRLISCYYLPGFLGRKWSTEEDMKYLAAELPTIRSTVEPSIYAIMAEFILDNTQLSKDERADIVASMPVRIQNQ